jgi:hypothetical protein
MNPTLKGGKFPGSIMTNRTETITKRQLKCASCGTEFSCDVAGDCWCKDETLRLPMPVAGEDCLCQNCLRALAQVEVK